MLLVLFGGSIPWVNGQGSFQRENEQQTTNNEQLLQRYEFTQPKMGTSFRIILYARSDSIAQAAARAAFAKIDALNTILSDYEPESEINLLSNNSGDGKLVKVSLDLWRVLANAQQVSLRSKGAFDVTIGPLSKLWRAAFKRRMFPKLDRVEVAKQLVDFRKLRMDSTFFGVQLMERGMFLDVGGIAKGYAVDEAMKVLRKYGIQSALVDGGGDILVGDAPPNKEGWTIQIGTASSQKRMNLTNAAVATSGDTYQYLEWEGQRYSHIIDPRTGFGVKNQKQVTILAPVCTMADALASAVSVLGESNGKTLVSQFPKCQVIFADFQLNHQQININNQSTKSTKTHEEKKFR